MDELWMRSVATVYEGKIEDFKRLAEEMLSTIRDKDSDTLNFAIFLDEPTRVAVFLEEYASSAGWLAHRRTSAHCCRESPRSASSRRSRSMVTRRRRHA
jgi:quinol monooxygenase YgiN